jgi:hypothetical protein
MATPSIGPLPQVHQHQTALAQAIGQPFGKKARAGASTRHFPRDAAVRHLAAEAATSTCQLVRMHRAVRVPPASATCKEANRHAQDSYVETQQFRFGFGS